MSPVVALNRRSFLAGASAFAGAAISRLGGSSYATELPPPAVPGSESAVALDLVAAERPMALPCFGGGKLPLWTLADGAWPPVVRLKLGQPWLDNGTLERVSPRNVPSPHAHYLCWRTGTMDRWECAAFADWLKRSLA